MMWMPDGLRRTTLGFKKYKNHVKADAKTKLIDEYTVTDAFVHDSQAIEQLLSGIDERQNIFIYKTITYICLNSGIIKVVIRGVLKGMNIIITSLQVSYVQIAKKQEHKVSFMPEGQGTHSI